MDCVLILLAFILGYIIAGIVIAWTNCRDKKKQREQKLNRRRK